MTRIAGSRNGSGRRLLWALLIAAIGMQGEGGVRESRVEGRESASGDVADRARPAPATDGRFA